MNVFSSSKSVLLACLTVYVVALAVAIEVNFWLHIGNFLLAAAVYDLIATIVVFAFSVIFNNSSIYDPYWSLAPVAMAVYWWLNSGGDLVSLHQFIVLLLLFAWAFRLTFNCFKRWKSLKQEDWRYAEMRPKAGRLYWPLSFFGFHLFPTVIVFSGCLSLYAYFSGGNKQFGILDIMAIAVTAAAIWLETKADREMDAFRSDPKNAGKNIDSGLWAYSRHPNYFGEVLFWWGLYLFGLSVNPDYWWFVIGPLAITLLFIFISVPMMDRHMLERNGTCAQNMKRISALVPWFRRG